ncbi:MAG: esterase/lipase family protein, partial [Acutalibacteraceae bacterium]
YDFAFYYDWRVDMWDVADDLSAYINDVIEVTGSPKVNLVGRCMGGNIVAAYLTKYGGDKIEKCLFYATTANGTFECGGPFSGQLEVEGDALARYASDILGDDCLNEFIRTTLDLYNEATGMKLPVKMVTFIYNKIYENLVPRLLMSTYASFPSYWEMVDPAHYEAAKEFAFSGKETEYADFIAQIDNYHNNVMLPLHDTLKTLEENGMKIYVVAKYGKQMVPITKEADCLGDDTVELTSSSFGATCSTVKSALSESYISEQTEKGLERYISPDKQVDASTCLFPDRTWFIKDSKHLDFIKAIDEMMLVILRCNGDMTVNDDANYPQFMVQIEEKTIEPMTSDNMNTDGRWNPSLMKAVFNFFTAMFRLLADAVRNGGFKK